MSSESLGADDLAPTVDAPAGMNIDVHAPRRFSRSERDAKATTGQHRRRGFVPLHAHAPVTCFRNSVNRALVKSIRRRSASV